MIKKITITLLAFITSVVVMAQQESVGKQINQIKRNPLYIYNEATMATEEEAREVACEMLLQQVKEYVKSKKYLVEADNILIKDIKTKSESLMMRRGTMYRVFVYVSKIDIEPVSNVTNINSSTGATMSTNKVVAKVTEPQTPIVSKEKEDETIKNNETIEPNKVIAPEVNSQPAEVREKNAQPTSSREVATTNMQSTNLPKWQKQVIETLLKCDDVSSVISKLNRFKSEYMIKRYGTADKCQSVANSYWIIFDNEGNLITILGIGENERMDYSSMQTSSLEKYRGMNALWFNFAK